MEPVGFKYLDEKIGSGALLDEPCVVAVHYSVSFAESGQVIGTSREKWPLTFALGKHDVPIMADAVRGMRIGGVRRLVVPAHKIPGTQIRNVPKDQAGESLRMEIELLGVVTGLGAIIPNVLPPGSRRLTIARFLFALSFLPYFLPEDVKPEMWRGHSIEEVQATREASANSVWLGGAPMPLEDLFPPDVSP